MLAYPELKPKHSVNSKLLYFTWESCQRMESKQKKKKRFSSDNQYHKSELLDCAFLKTQQASLITLWSQPYDSFL